MPNNRWKHVAPERSVCHECGRTFAKKSWGRQEIIDYHECQIILRQAIKKAQQQTDRGYAKHYNSKMPLHEMYYVGWCGEYAVHRMLGVPWTLPAIGRSDAGFDVRWAHRKWQIKTTKGYGKDLYFQSKQLARFKRYDGVILVHKEEIQDQFGLYWVAGWMWMGEFLECKHQVDTFGKPSLRVKAKCFCLNSVDELLQLGCPPAKIAGPTEDRETDTTPFTGGLPWPTPKKRPKT